MTTSTLNSILPSNIGNGTSYTLVVWHREYDSEAMRARGIIVLEFRKIRLVGQKYRDKTTLANKTRFSRLCFGFTSRRFSLLVGYNI